MGARFLHGRDSDLMIWEDSGAVSMSGFSGSTPHPNQRRLHASNAPSQVLRASVRRALSQRVLERGRKFWFLFVQLSNPT
jgi:hypothetical protein